MADLRNLYKNRSADEVVLLLAQATLLAQKKSKINWYDIQNELKVGAQEAYIIFDWLADKHEAEPHISNHWIRCGRAYLLNNPFPTLADMAKSLRVGERRAFLIMIALEKRGLLSIKQDFAFERKGRMSSFKDLVRQMQRVAKKYGGRCEPQLLIRTLYIDPMTATRLAQYGEEHLGMIWRHRPSELR